MFILLSLFACLTPGNPCANQNTPSWCVAAVDSGTPEGDADTDSDTDADTDSDADVDTDTDTDSHLDSGHDSGLMTDSNPDSTVADTSVIDSGMHDSAADSADTAVVDTATETGLSDSGVIDSGPLDSGHDSSVTDSASGDSADTAVTETGLTDSASTDSASDSGTDSGVTDTAIVDTAVTGIDADSDGYEEGVDCNDAVDYINPGESESSLTASDDNCDGLFAHTSGTTFALSDGTGDVTFAADNMITDSCDVSMSCAATSGWGIFSYTLGTTAMTLADLSFPSTLGESAAAMVFDNTGGAASIEDECRYYVFTAVIGTEYGMTFLVTNEDSIPFSGRVYGYSDYLVDRTTATDLYDMYLAVGYDGQAVVAMTAADTTDGFVLCGGGVTSADAVGFTEVYIGPITR